MTERFWSFVARTRDGCWNWKGAMRGGYGRFIIQKNFKKSQLQAHRLALMLDGRQPEPGQEADHLCRNKRCVRPAHLEWVSHRTNVVRGVGPTAENQRKTHCVNGHELVWGHRRRICQPCANRRFREHWERKGGIEARRIYLTQRKEKRS